MNKQKTKKGRGIEWTDYTWNPISGCMHGCRWEMPDGTIATCYAEDTAEGIAKDFYPEGFDHHYWKPERLKEPGRVKTPSKIFVGSMADIFGHWVPTEQIEQVLEVCRTLPHHTFQFLTKNLVRAEKFVFPDNCWIGVSSPPDYMWGKKLSQGQKNRMLIASLERFDRIRARTKWVSFEPLSQNYAHIVNDYPTFEWAVIGAASQGSTYHAPRLRDFDRLVEMLDLNKIPVFYKGNISVLNPNPWREEFPNE